MVVILEFVVVHPLLKSVLNFFFSLVKFYRILFHSVFFVFGVHFDGAGVVGYVNRVFKKHAWQGAEYHNERENNNDKPLYNRLVRLESGAKRDIGTYTTGENGLFYVPDLAPGNYVLTEIKAPAGYILDPTPQSIYIEGGKLNTVEVFNIPYSSLRILKISADDDRKPLEGAIFKLFDEKRLEIGTYTTSALGEIFIPSLPSGIYFLQEQKAPAGYMLDNTVRQIELSRAFGGF